MLRLVQINHAEVGVLIRTLLHDRNRFQSPPIKGTDRASEAVPKRGSIPARHVNDPGATGSFRSRLAGTRITRDESRAVHLR